MLFASFSPQNFFLFVLFCTKNMKKAHSDHHLECAVPKQRSKYTTKLALKFLLFWHLFGPLPSLFWFSKPITHTLIISHCSKLSDNFLSKDNFLHLSGKQYALVSMNFSRWLRNAYLEEETRQVPKRFQDIGTRYVLLQIRLNKK